MSMISGLIDELNKSADEWNTSNMFELARMCREAADTIWKLRDDLQRANDAVRDAKHDESRAWDRVRKAEAENAKLREQVERLRTQLADMTESVGRVEERCAKTFEVGKRWMAKAARFEAENAKLRELVREVYALHWHGLDCTECPWFDECDTDGGCPWLSIMHDHMRELRIEVDG